MRSGPSPDMPPVSQGAAEDAARSVHAAIDLQLRTVFDSAPIGILMAEMPSGRILGGNVYVETLLGHPIKPMASVQDYDAWVSYHEDGSRVLGREHPLARMALDGDLAPELEVHYQRGDGARAWIRIMARPVLSDAGELVAGVAVLVDIDRLRRAEQALALGLAVSGFGLGSIDYVNGTITLDPRAGELFDLPGGEPLSRARLHDRFHPDDRAWLFAAIAKLVGPDGEGSFAGQHRIVRSDGAVRWISARKQVFYGKNERGQRQALNGVLAVHDITESKVAEESRLLLLHELNHRVKNLFAVAVGMVKLTARSATTVDDMATALSWRLTALARAHELIQDAVLGQSSARDVELGEIVRVVLQPHTRSEAHLRLGGPPVLLGPEATTSLALILHELATNAGKYGAFSVPNGQVGICWSLGEDHFEIGWAESNGPIIEKPPEHRGFGTQLARLSATGQLGGTIHYDWRPAGLVVEITVPLDRLRR